MFHIKLNKIIFDNFLNTEFSCFHEQFEDFHCLIWKYMFWIFLLRYLKRTICDSYHWFYDSNHHVWHPIALLHLNSEETKHYVELRKYDPIYNYFETSRIWVDKNSIDAWEYDPNQDLDENLNYIKSIHPFNWYIEFKYCVSRTYFQRTLNRKSRGMV